MLDGPPLFRIEAFKVGGCRWHGRVSFWVEHSPSVIPAVRTMTSAGIGAAYPPIADASARWLRSRDQLIAAMFELLVADERRFGRILWIAIYSMSCHKFFVRL
jgi:hypothetical protein